MSCVHRFNRVSIEFVLSFVDNGSNTLSYHLIFGKVSHRSSNSIRQGPRVSRPCKKWQHHRYRQNYLTILTPTVIVNLTFGFPFTLRVSVKYSSFPIPIIIVPAQHRDRNRRRHVTSHVCVCITIRISWYPYAVVLLVSPVVRFRMACKHFVPVSYVSPSLSIVRVLRYWHIIRASIFNPASYIQRIRCGPSPVLFNPYG